MLKRLAQWLSRPMVGPGPVSGGHGGAMGAASADCPTCRSLLETHAALEQRASRLALQERRFREATSAARVCAVHWEVESGQINWESGFGMVMRASGLTWTDEMLNWTSVLEPGDLERLRAQTRLACESGIFFEARFDLRGHGGRWDVRIRGLPDPLIRGQTCTVRGLVGITRVGDHAVMASPPPGVGTDVGPRPATDET